MSTLKDSINRFLSYFKQNHPTLAESIAPGLATHEIEEMTSFLPFKLSNEIYDFFQEINGSGQFFFLGFWLQSLEQTLEYSQYFTDFIDANGNPNDFNYMGNPLFTILQMDTDSLSIVCDGQLSQSPVCITVGCGIGVLFANLTSMMQTFAEGLETGAIYFDDESESFELNSEKITPIYKKYNSDIPRLISEYIKTNYLYAPIDSDQLVHQCSWLRKFWNDITLEQLGDAEAIEIILKASQDSSNHYVQTNVRFALEELNYSTGIVDEQWQGWLEWYGKVKKEEAFSPADPGLLLMQISEQLENIRARPPQQED
jgi:hypothetical protein